MKRRDFLKCAGLMAVAASMPAVSLFGADNDNALDIDADNDADLHEIEQDDLDAHLSKQITAIVIGAGNRGRIYSNYAKKFPESLKIVGVSDINTFRQQNMAASFEVDAEHIFGDWSEVFKVPKFADAVIITTPDDLHYKPCMKALEMGYDVLLEKPCAQSEQECLNILRQTKKYGRIVAVCHVLRYAPYFQALNETVKSGQIGRVVSIQHMEPIEATHMAHSYVRGNWHDSKATTPIILAKSCHDLDIIKWILNKKCTEVSAFGDLTYFKAANAPAGSADRCVNCSVERSCPFSSIRQYFDRRGRLHVLDLTPGLDKEAQGREIMEKLKTSDYGRCVFHCDNDQCDHFVMNMKFEDDTTVAFSMEGLTSYGGRQTRIMGTKGDIVGDMKTFTVTDFLTGKKSTWQTDIRDGHGGGDHRLVRDFLSAVSAHDEKFISSSIDASIQSHIMGFKAEVSRKTGKTVKM